MNKKFRIWDGEKFYFAADKINIYPAGFSDTFGLFFDITPNERIETGPSGYSKKKKITIQQFTGLLDKNGKEIYEGDAVFSNDDEEVYTVVFHKGMFCVRYPNGTFGPLYEFPEVAVCGNIFEP